jgi:hypothetical protein
VAIRKFIGVAGAVLMLIVVLAGCGGSPGASGPSKTAQPAKSAPAEDPVERTFAASVGAEKATCTREGWMVFVGARSTVYGCTTKPGVSLTERCYVYIDGTVQDVTDRLVHDTEPWGCTSKLRTEAARKAKAAWLVRRRARAAFNKGWSVCSHSEYQGAIFKAAQAGDQSALLDGQARARALARTLADRFHAPAQNRGNWIQGCAVAVS